MKVPFIMVATHIIIMCYHNFAQRIVGKQKDVRLVEDATDMEQDTEGGSGGRDDTDREGSPPPPPPPRWKIIDIEKEPGGNTTDTEGPGTAMTTQDDTRVT